MSTRWLAVGYFFSVLPFSTAGLFGELKSKWGLHGLLSYTPLRNNRFMLEFEREGDRRHVLENGPWTGQGGGCVGECHANLGLHL